MQNDVSMSSYQNCRLCPRRCGINRNCTDAPLGYCGESAALRIACASIHYGEEPPISGSGEQGKSGGSGTIFVSGCNLGCVFCQNHQISHGSQTPEQCKTAALGQTVDTAEFAEICLALQKKGALNINIVTGSHAVPAIAEGINAAKSKGLQIPVLWNSSAYELPETLDILKDMTDVFLPDLKTLDSGIAGQYFNAPDYPVIASSAIKKMTAMRPLRFSDDSAAKLVSGVIVRHLVLPNHLDSSREVLRWFADNCAGKALLSLMFQFTPITPETPVINNHVDIRQEDSPNRYISQAEYETVLGWLSEFGIEDGFCQELVPGNTDWLPDFEEINPFPSDLSIPVWHWKIRFIL